MDVRSDRRYEFAVETGELWRALIRTEDYQDWWPWLRVFEATSFSPGQRWVCVVQPPLPYTVRFGLVLGQVVEGRLVTASVDGDIVGDARLDITPTTGGSELRLVSRLAPSNTLLRTVARIARPLAVFGHDWVLDTGLRQFSSRALP